MHGMLKRAYSFVAGCEARFIRMMVLNPTLAVFPAQWCDPCTSAECSAAGAKVVGVKQEGTYSARVNGGLFSSFAVNGALHMYNAVARAIVGVILPTRNVWFYNCLV